MKKRYREEGAVVLETSIVLPIFILIILSVYGLFAVTSVQNEMGHALNQASKSLSLDPYITERFDSIFKANSAWDTVGGMIVDIGRSLEDDHYSSNTDWYNTEVGLRLDPTFGYSTGYDDAYRGNVAKKRIVGFLVSGEDDLDAEADNKLKAIGVVDGLDGVTVSMSVADGFMTITMNYQIQFWIDVFGAGKIPVEQSATVRLWK